MATRFTAAFGKQIAALGEDPQRFAEDFDRWKNDGPAGEYASFLFGKDGYYTTPYVNGAPCSLRHVHLVPLADQHQLRIWKIQWSRQSRKTSNRVLVYVTDATFGHLLIFILNEPDAHAIARMRTPAHSLLMSKFARIAERFFDTGAIIG